MPEARFVLCAITYTDGAAGQPGLTLVPVAPLACSNEFPQLPGIGGPAGFDRIDGCGHHVQELLLLVLSCFGSRAYISASFSLRLREYVRNI